MTRATPQTRDTSTHARPCDACGMSGCTVRRVFATPEHRVERCLHCGKETLRPLPSPADARQTYRDYGTTQRAEAELEALIDWSGDYLQHIVARTGLVPSRARYLEVGFGDGAALVAGCRLGFETHGYDLGEHNVRHAETLRARLGLDYSCERADATSYGGRGPFQLIKASQVIEHVLEPDAMLSRLAALQDPGGWLVIDCPNNDALFYRIKNGLRRRYHRMRFYNSLEIGEHLHGFNRRALSSLLTRSGYEVVALDDYSALGSVAQAENRLYYPSVPQGIRRSLRERRSYHVLKASIPLFDRLSSLTLSSGTGLLALARRR